MDVYTGTSITNLHSAPDFSIRPEDHLFRAEAGVPFSFPITSHEEGFMPLRLTRANPPPNDDLANRIELTGAHVSLVASNFDATTEPGDPLGDAISRQTVWWKWRAPASGWTTVRVNNGVGSFKGGVYTGDAISNLVRVATASYSWPLRFVAEQGVEYSIGVTTWSDFAMQFPLTLDLEDSSASSSGRSEF